MAEINSLEEHEALQYEIHRRGYNKYGVRSDAYIPYIVCQVRCIHIKCGSVIVVSQGGLVNQMYRFWLADTTSMVSGQMHI